MGWGAASQGKQKQLPRAASPGGPGGLTADVVPRIRVVPEGVLCLIAVMVQTFSLLYSGLPNFLPNPVPFSWPIRKGVLSASQSKPCWWRGGWGVAPTRLGVTGPL